MKVLNSMSFHIVLWSISHESGIHLDPVVLITVLRAQHFCQFQFTCLSVHLAFIRDGVKNLFKISVNNIHCSPLIHEVISLKTDVMSVSS